VEHVPSTVPTYRSAFMLLFQDRHWVKIDPTYHDDPAVDCTLPGECFKAVGNSLAWRPTYGTVCSCASSTTTTFELFQELE
jgi:hypothetical protein